MHQFHLMHIDIKNENILYSPSLNKLVFIDFGLSKFVAEQVGKKTLTKYAGNANFWSPQMQLCFTSKKSMHVDLYYNDLHCL